jgi:hypothetical protein
MGGTYLIKWTHAGKSDPYVEIELLKGGSVVSIIANSTPIGLGGSGQYLAQIPRNLPNGSDYQIKVTSTQNAAVSPRFTIISAFLLGVAQQHDSQPEYDCGQHCDARHSDEGDSGPETAVAE